MDKNEIKLDSDEKKELFWLSNDIKLEKGLNDNKYYKDGNSIKFEDDNGNPIKFEDDNGILEKKFQKIVRSQTMKFINKGFDNIVVLVGAGASVIDNNLDKDEKGFAKAGVTVSKIAEEVLNQLENKEYELRSSDKTEDTRVEVFTLEEISKKSKYMEKILDDSKEKKLCEEFNLEDLLSKVFLYEQFVSKQYENKFKNTKEAIMDIIIKSTSYPYDKDRFNHEKFLNILASLKKRESKLNIVTTNYDTLLEDAAENMKWTVFDGFSFSQTPTFDSTMFDWNLVKNVPNVKTNEKIYKSNVANLLKIHGSLTWTKYTEGNNNKEDIIIKKNKNGIDKPVMIFPSSNKYEKSYQEPYFDLFHKFQELVHQPNTLLITTGFSFSDDHIARMILSAIKTNDELSTLITDYHIADDDTNDNFIALKKEMTNFYNIAFLKATMNNNLTYYMGGTDEKY
ncbi:hypothetical protein AKUG0403_PLPX00050 (plasmid) [Apilactobacillus kunkeei]|nr:hypothetical protein AKUG0403_PLPX00050 [Apilactobacillus kunkeei]